MTGSSTPQDRRRTSTRWRSWWHSSAASWLACRHHEVRGTCNGCCERGESQREGGDVKTGGITPPARSTLRCERLADDTLLVHLVGHWTIRAGIPVVTEVYQQLDTSPPVRRLAFAAQELTAWDSRLLTFLRQVMEASSHRQLVVELQGLPEGVHRLLALAAAVPEREGARRGAPRPAWLARLGTAGLANWKGAWDM